MWIKSLNLNDTFVPVIGYVKIGAKGDKITTSTGKQFRKPIRLDHFIVTTLEIQNDNFLLDPIALEDYGEAPIQIPIVLPGKTIQEVFDTFFAYYTASGLICIGDGETASRYSQEKAAEITVSCDPSTCPYYQKGLCKPHGELNMYLRTGENFELVRLGGVYQFKTTSWSTIYSLMNSIQTVSKVVGEDLYKTPLWLVFARKTIRNANGEFRSVPVVRVELYNDVNKTVPLGGVSSEQGDLVEEETVEEVKTVPASFNVEKEEEKAEEETKEAKPEKKTTKKKSKKTTRKKKAAKEEPVEAEAEAVTVPEDDLPPF